MFPAMESAIVSDKERKQRVWWGSSVRGKGWGKLTVQPAARRMSSWVGSSTWGDWLLNGSGRELLVFAGWRAIDPALSKAWCLLPTRLGTTVTGLWVGWIHLLLFAGVRFSWSARKHLWIGTLRLKGPDCWTLGSWTASGRDRGLDYAQVQTERLRVDLKWRDRMSLQQGDRFSLEYRDRFGQRSRNRLWVIVRRKYSQHCVQHQASVRLPLLLHHETFYAVCSQWIC